LETIKEKKEKEEGLLRDQFIFKKDKVRYLVMASLSVTSKELKLECFK
jgi:hypothetical protein